MSIVGKRPAVWTLRFKGWHVLARSFQHSTHPGKHETFTQCWNNAGPALYQHWVNVSRSSVYSWARYAWQNTAAYVTKPWLNAALMLGRRGRRWANMKPALGQHFMFASWTVCLGLNMPPKLDDITGVLCDHLTASTPAERTVIRTTW